ncbi:MAG TPA: Hsp20/alpha crystallin family protein [Thermodesulfobacteriota bacterium]
MAKISRKPPRPSIKVESSSEFIFECGVDASGLLSPEPITHIPTLDIFATPSELVMEMELPGVRREDIDITLSKDAITVRAVKFECFDEDKINYVCMERSFGRLFRSIDLPCPVDTARVKATCLNGILTITLPKVEDKRNSTKKVQIESV